MGPTGDGYLSALLTRVDHARLLEVVGPVLARNVTVADGTGLAQATVRLDGRLESVRVAAGSPDPGRACVDAVRAARAEAGRSLSEQLPTLPTVADSSPDDEALKVEAEVRRIAREIAAYVFEGSAGGVSASVTGLGVLVDLTINGEPDALGDAVVQAVHAAEAQARRTMRERISGLPLGGRTLGDFLPGQ
jgi:DNA-binding protein YbaB